jgi:drug/metabolite transporter (DMT)-like permease
MKSRQPNPKKISAKKKIIPILFVAAVFDGMGNIFFVLVDKLNNLVLGSIFLAITPALIGIFAYIVFKDRFNKLQLLGLFIIVSAGVLISL